MSDSANSVTLQHKNAYSDDSRRSSQDSTCLTSSLHDLKIYLQNNNLPRINRISDNSLVDDDDDAHVDTKKIFSSLQRQSRLISKASMQSQMHLQELEHSVATSVAKNRELFEAQLRTLRCIRVGINIVNTRLNTLACVFVIMTLTNIFMVCSAIYFFR